MKENPFKEESREYPVFYKYPMDIKNVVTIDIPQGYKLESFPEPIRFSLPGKKASFKYTITEKESQLIIYHFFTISDNVFLPSEYEGLKEFYNMILKKEAEKLVFAKI